MTKGHLYFLLAILFMTVAGLWLAGPMPQDPAYHDFADQRMLFGFPNCWNVASNMPMFFVGVYALWHSLRFWRHRPEFASRLIPVVLSLGIITACFGSMYYHWAPDNLTLVWDRLPMTLMFMPLLALVIYDFLGKKAGQLAFLILLPLGIFSVLYWRYTESTGQGDLRFYAFVQFFPMLIAPLLIWLNPGKVPYVKYLLLVLGWYALAKIAEYFDTAIFDTLRFWSGHTVKHLLGAVSLVYVFKILANWKIQPALREG